MVFLRYFGGKNLFIPMQKEIVTFLFSMLFALLSVMTSAESSVCCPSATYNDFDETVTQRNSKQQEELFATVRKKIQDLSYSGNVRGLTRLSDSLRRTVVIYNADSIVLADTYYYIGVSELLASRYNLALSDLEECILLKKKLHMIDELYSKALFNAGIACTYVGDFIQVIQYMKEYAGLAGELFSNDGPEVIEAYTALSGASIELREYGDFIDYSLKALGILNSGKITLSAISLSNLYSTIGVGYARIGDYAKARIYLENAESVMHENKLPADEQYINLINSLAFTYGYLGFADKANEYLSRGIDLAVDNTSALAFNLIHSHAVGLGRSGKTSAGEELLASVVNKAKAVYGTDSRLYISQLKNYAGYLAYFSPDATKSLIEYNPLLEYIREHRDDEEMKNQVLQGYARALYRTGENLKALEYINELLFKTSKAGSGEKLYANPVIDSISTSTSSLSLLQLKYDILWDLYSEYGKIQILESVAQTSELIISLIDRIRISISEEESRILLGDKYRTVYLLAIRDFELCFRITGQSRYMDKAFEFAEKSKVASLLEATRQLRAIQFHIPQQLAAKENTLQRTIGFYSSMIAAENEKKNPDTTLIPRWNEKLLSAIAGRDSLLVTFEKDYNGYYNLKYNTRIASMKEIPRIAGRNSNYINYVLSDSVLYIFLANRKHSKIVTIRTDSSFMKNLVDFRVLLSDPSQSESARTKFNRYLQIGHDLYRILIEPVQDYFISDNLLISPDNILSYLPFETFLSAKYNGSEILYRKLDYLMNDFSISYAYSATFMNENTEKNPRGIKKMIAFAPSYLHDIGYDTLFTRLGEDNTLQDLPFARQEAEYAAVKAKGALYLNEDATETLFKEKAANYSIIHMAMHTVVDDQKPMNSAMLFSSVKDTLNDGLFHTYEVYGIPLNANMVVLSSCNTGSGVLSSGEGILSLARGFLYSGSQSVVMSLWQVDDRSGTDIVKMFYDNLKKGMKKSMALKKARNKYLKTANQLKSHPYFWSTLVIFGDNSPVFFRINSFIIISLSLLAVIGLMMAIYFRKFKNS